MAFKFSEALCCGEIVAGKIRSDKGNNDEEDDDIEFCNKREGSTSNKEAKNNDQKANALRSKHSVTEQRRRSKINERFQILRSLIPLSDQKRDTASFLLEVIEYVQFLQERVQRYEGLYHGWNTEQSKSITSRNNQWRMPNFGEQQTRNCSAISGGFGEHQMCIHPAMFTNAQNTLTYDPSSDDLACCKPLDPHPDIVNKELSVRTPSQTSARDPLLEEHLQRPPSDTRSADFPRPVDLLNQPEDLVVEAGNISISTAYSHGLLNVLSQSLHSSGVDLNQAQISVQIELGKRASQAEPSRSTALGECGLTHFGEASSEEEDTDECTKRMKL